MSFIHFSLSSMALILLLALASIFVSPTVSTSLNPKNGFQVTLRRVDFDGNFTKSELLQRAMQRGRKRMERLYSMTTLAASNVDIDAPVRAGDGDFLMDFSIGTPPMPFSATLDTGSDLIWTQCKNCNPCFNQQTPMYDPNQSSSFSKLSCSSNLCKTFPGSTLRCTNSNCEYFDRYGSGSTSTQGVMATETFTFDKVSVPNLGFGCGYEQNGEFDGAGIVGLGRGQLSLVSQLDEPKFSYCLKSIDSKTSTLFMGSRASTTPGNSIITTPLIQNQLKHSFYYISLKGITVGKTLLPIDSSAFEIKSDGSGGVIIDSGTTLTFLEKSAFDLVKEEFSNQVNEFPNSQGTYNCFPLGVSLDQLPTLTFHFEGPADLELSPENYLIRGENGLGCLAMGSSDDLGISIFGNIMQHNTLVVYDLAQHTLSFVPTHCAD